jgi:hypothetical protein
MSWNFRKAGKDVAALKAAVQVESAPQALKDEVCARIDYQRAHYPNAAAILVHSYGHLETTSDGSLTLRGASIFIDVQPVSWIDTPVAT